MRILLLFFAALALGALAASPVQAANYEFSTSVHTPGLSVSDISVTVSDNIKNENIRWDERDVALLKKALLKKVSNRLNRQNLMNKDGVRLELVLVDITPNRPTFREMSKRPSLNYVSFGLGGAEVDAHFIAADGTELGKMHYRYYADNLYDYSAGATTWYDARRSFDKFSRRLVKELITPSSS